MKQTPINTPTAFPIIYTKNTSLVFFGVTFEMYKRPKNEHWRRMTTKEYNDCVDQYADNIYRFVLKHLKNVDAAKDVVQETFAKVWVRKEKISAEKAKSYMFTTARNTIIDLLRKEKYAEEVDKIDAHFSEGPVKNMDLQEILHDALDQLPEIQRSVILLRDYEGYPYDEIGEITGLNESQVKVYIFRARKKLKEILVSVEAVLDV